MTPDEIRALRDKLGMSQRELALAVGYLTGKVVYSWERGTTKPTGPALKLLEQLREKYEEGE